MLHSLPQELLVFTSIPITFIHFTFSLYYSSKEGTFILHYAFYYYSSPCIYYYPPNMLQPFFALCYALFIYLSCISLYFIILGFIGVLHSISIVFPNFPIFFLILFPMPFCLFSIARSFARLVEQLWSARAWIKCLFGSRRALKDIADSRETPAVFGTTRQRQSHRLSLLPFPHDASTITFLFRTRGADPFHSQTPCGRLHKHCGASLHG